jgi:hypothetical protein
MSSRELPIEETPTCARPLFLSVSRILARPYFGKDGTSPAIPDWNERVTTCI